MSLQNKISKKELETLFKEHFPMLCLVSYGIVKDKEAAKDNVQDFFISYWQRRASISITTSFKAYAIRAVKNLSLLSLEKVKKERALLQALDTYEYEDPKDFEPAKDCEKNQLLLNQLPERRKLIFISAIINGQSYAEIAEMYGISINTVKTQIKRAYAFLRTETSENLSDFLLFATLIFLDML